jgi:dTDP-4-dehydrorhamnose reductase
MWRGFVTVGCQFVVWGRGLLTDGDVADVAVRYLGEADKAALPRVLQFSSEDKYTKYEMCQLFGEIMGVPIDRIKPNTEGNDPNASVQRPYDCHLSTKALKDLGIDVSTQDFVGWWRRECRAFRH